MKRIIVTVINDLETDQRVHKVCSTLHNMGFEVLLVGRRKRLSRNLKSRDYQTKRMDLLFEKGPFFYLEFNVRLFFLLLMENVDVIYSNDLDTLPASFVASRLRKKNLVYDTHEYFTGVPELLERPKIRSFWKKIEDFIFPRLKTVLTVNESVARLYKGEYGVDVKVLRNIPAKKDIVVSDIREKLGVSRDTFVVLYQGSVNKDRGLEEAIKAMHYVNQPAKLVIVGGGDIVDDLKGLCKTEGLEKLVIFAGQVSFDELNTYTPIADIGISLEKPTNINYLNSLPNKFFDYIQANVPVLISDLPEMTAVLDKYDIGVVCKSHDPKVIASCIEQMKDEKKIYEWKKALKIAADEYCWENEELVLKDIFKLYV